MAIFRDIGIPVRKTEVGEGDLILDILTKYHNTINAVAPGARKLLSRKRGNIEIGVVSSFSFAEGKNRAIVLEAEAQKTMKALRDSRYGVDFLMDLVKVARILFLAGDTLAYSILEITLDTANGVCAKMSELKKAGKPEKDERGVLCLLREWFYYKALRWSGLIEGVGFFEDQKTPPHNLKNRLTLKDELILLKDSSKLENLHKLTSPVVQSLISDYYE